MKENTSKESTRAASQPFRRSSLYVSVALLALACVASPPIAHGQYRQVNLVSDLPGVAILQDTNLVNAWGVSFSASSPFWISDNGTGKSTLYAVTNDSSGAAS